MPGPSKQKPSRGVWLALVAVRYPSAKIKLSPGGTQSTAVLPDGQVVGTYRDYHGGTVKPLNQKATSCQRPSL